MKSSPMSVLISKIPPMPDCDAYFDLNEYFSAMKIFAAQSIEDKIPAPCKEIPLN